MSGFTSSTSHSRLLKDLLDQFRRDADRADDTQERIQQHLAMINEGATLKPGERHYAG